MAIFRCVGCSTKQTNNKKRQADKSRLARNRKIKEENRTERHKLKRAKRNNVQVKPTKQIPSGI
jgi:hypothetical protein